MFPITTNLKPITTPWATYAIIGTNVIIHFIITWNTNLVIPSEIASTLGFVPASFGDLSKSHRLVTCMFLHGDLIHLSGNMLFLLVFGRRLEFGASNFLAFYVTTGVTGCLAHAIVESESTKPLIGASGAISAVLGAFLMTNPGARITLVLDPILIFVLRRLIVRLPAWFFLISWILLQLALAVTPRSLNIAFWAHVGGFFGGMVSAIAIFPHFSKEKYEYFSSRLQK